MCVGWGGGAIPQADGRRKVLLYMYNYFLHVWMAIYTNYLANVALMGAQTK